MNDTLGANSIIYSTVTKYLKGKSFSKLTRDTDFELKIEEKFLDGAIFGALKECPFPPSAILPKQ
jgi:hypothetical protein